MNSLIDGGRLTGRELDMYSNLELLQYDIRTTKHHNRSHQETANGPAAMAWPRSGRELAMSRAQSVAWLQSFAIKRIAVGLP